MNLCKHFWLAIQNTKNQYYTLLHIAHLEMPRNIKIHKWSESIRYLHLVFRQSPKIQNLNADTATHHVDPRFRTPVWWWLSDDFKNPWWPTVITIWTTAKIQTGWRVAPENVLKISIRFELIYIILVSHIIS